MSLENGGALRETVWEIYDYIGQNLYLNRPDMEVKGKGFNAALLISLLTALCEGKELIIGEPGLGKTTSAEYVCALLYGFPLGTIWGSEVSGHPEQTEEKIIGRPDLGRLNQGEEVVVWSHFALLPVKIVDDFEEEILDSTRPAEGAIGLGPGRSLDADILYYMKLAENWMLPVRNTQTKKSGSLYPHHHEPWEVGKPCQDIDPWTSFGKIMPGITQTWRRLEGEVFGQWEGIPDCVVMIDSSGSMTNPRQTLSYAVLGAACACDAYLRKDARVAVYNFSDAESGGRRILPYSRRRREVYQNLCHYFGGGTRLAVEDIEILQEKGAPDLFLITDMQITNLEVLIRYFNQCENRVTAVHIGDNRHVASFRKSMALRKNVDIYGVEKKEDIPRIVPGKVRDYLYRGTP